MRATRRQALGGAAALLASGVPAWAATPPDDEQLQETALVAVLDLEQTAEVAYEAIANAGVLTDILRGFLDHEHQHVEQLLAALDAIGVDPPIAPRRTEIAGLERARRGRVAAARFAIDLELRTVGAYQRAIRDLLDPNVMRTCAGAMGCDAQQLVVLREAAGLRPVPDALERGRP